MKSVLILYVLGIWKYASCSVQPWYLQRAENDESRIVFKNTTVTGKLMLTSWSWRDSLAGTWDTSLRVSLANESFSSGHLLYRDGYANEVIKVRWQQSPFTNLTWKALFASKFPSTSWNMSSDFLNWGYRPFSEHSWGFYVGENTFEAKPTGVKTLLTPLDDVLGLWSRRKRAAASTVKGETSPRSANFNLIDLFTGDGIFSALPQMLINVFSMLTNLFPTKSDDYAGGNEYVTKPDAEMVTTTKVTEMALRRTTPRL